MVAIVRETRGQLVSGMAVAPPARGHALLPPSDRWPEVCARSAGARALFEKLAASDGKASGKDGNLRLSSRCGGDGSKRSTGGEDFAARFLMRSPRTDTGTEGIFHIWK